MGQPVAVTAACRCFRVSSSNATSLARWTSVEVDLIVATAIRAAWSAGKPYTPVAIAGKATLRAPRRAGPEGSPLRCLGSGPAAARGKGPKRLPDSDKADVLAGASPL